MHHVYAFKKNSKNKINELTLEYVVVKTDGCKFDLVYLTILLATTDVGLFILAEF